MQQNGQENRQDSFCEPMAFMSKGGSMGAGDMPPPSLACAIFLRVVVGIQTYHAVAAYIQKRFVNRIAEGSEVYPTSP